MRMDGAYLGFSGMLAYIAWGISFSSPSSLLHHPLLCIYHLFLIDWMGFLAPLDEMAFFTTSGDGVSMVEGWWRYLVGTQSEIVGFIMDGRWRI
jgi:hypothetical protein